LCCLANVAIVPSSPTFIRQLAIYGLWNETLFPRSKLLFDALQLALHMHDASVVRPFVCESRLYCG